MAFGKEKIKEYFEEKAEEFSEKIEKTPMEKFFVFFLILITVSALVLGYLQFKKNIGGAGYPTYLREKSAEWREKYNSYNTNTAPTSEDMAKLQNQDSDLDGLDDYSEIYIYNTSAYLEDSDGDGKKDKDEILQGTDPNCAEGQNCQVEVGTGQAVNTNSSTINTSLPDQQAVLNNINLNDLSGLEAQLLSGQITLSQLGISDPKLEATLEQLRSGQTPDTNTGTTEPVKALTPEEQAKVAEQLKDITPTEIRANLLEMGFDQAQLEKIPDDILKEMFVNVLNSYTKQ